jgi:MurNAc alpha-1-phosphate uridylyltransferase
MDITTGAAMDSAMIFAAGRGARMRPLSDVTPKPLLHVGGKPLIVWQIEALAHAGFRHIVINHAWLGEQFAPALGDGSRYGVTLHYSAESDSALETAGGIAKALPLLLRDTPAEQGKRFVAVSGDVYCDFDYAALRRREAAGDVLPSRDIPGMHLVMVPNPDFHPRGDFGLLADGRLAIEGGERLTFGNIGVYDSRLFNALAAQQPIPAAALGPMMRTGIDAGQVRGERFDGCWRNVGTPAQLAELDGQVGTRSAKIVT